MIKFYTIFLGEKIWKDIIDDMNSASSWGMGGKIWTSRKRANDCIKNLKRYDFETAKKKFKIIELFQKESL